jgi:hypothetical protein
VSTATPIAIPSHASLARLFRHTERYDQLVAESWHVTIRGQAQKLITCERVAADGEFLAFLDHAGDLVLMVRREELIALERYEEPPF